MIGKFFKNLRYKKMVKSSASFLLNDFSIIVNDTVEHFERNGKMKSALYKEVLKFESTAFILWLFQNSNLFPVALHKIILDELHNQYFESLRKNGYDFKLREAIGGELNVRYKVYNETISQSEDASKIGAKFIRFLTDKSKVDLDMSDILIPLYIMEKTKPRFQEYRKVVNI